ncbi:hypothetical protein ANCCAN_05986 [Ancylostoma caninum]|uniref:Uncharacterized protein n=1 Tax=Ancylostoma caninum TaxID=29170 RepID=A0A368GUF0_ANCCA|nr:hypothetical protein ANCCAN_05986 [Ancylostoma caninum]
MGNVPSFDKQSQRGTTNPWRKYGALKKLHEIGGIAPPGNTKGDRKNKDGFVLIKKGSRPPPPPRCAEVTLNKDKRNPGLLGRYVSRPLVKFRGNHQKPRAKDVMSLTDRSLLILTNTNSCGVLNLKK